MAKRKAISKTVRFEVFKRDAFTCQYCGRKAPDVVLNVDHIHPVAEGGGSDILNLITACFDCNAGKGPRTLTNDAAVNKQRAELERMAARREQLEMMISWREELRALDEYVFDYVVGRINESMPSRSLNEHGAAEVRAKIKRFDFHVIIDSIEAAASQYIRLDDNGMATSESAGLFLEKIWRIAHIKSNQTPEQQERTRQVAYLRAIIRSRLEGRYFDAREAWRLLDEALKRGANYDELMGFCRDISSWGQFTHTIRTF